MKIIPQHFCEKMEDWFGKRGISGHVTAFIMKKDSTRRQLTLPSLINVFKMDTHQRVSLKMSLSSLKMTFHWSIKFTVGMIMQLVIQAKVQVCKEANLEISALDFNEAQNGKDQRDRDAAVAKRCIRSYVNSGKDVLNSEDIKEALDSTPSTLPNTKTSVVKVMPNEGSIDKARIDITRYHYFKVEEDHLT